jgi:hypothetical protein
MIFDAIIDIFRATSSDFEFVTHREKKTIVQRLSEGNINLQQGNFLTEKEQKILLKKAISVKI